MQWNDIILNNDWITWCLTSLSLCPIQKDEYKDGEGFAIGTHCNTLSSVTIIMEMDGQLDTHSYKLMQYLFKLEWYSYRETVVLAIWCSSFLVIVWYCISVQCSFLVIDWYSFSVQCSFLVIDWYSFSVQCSFLVIV